MERPVIFNYHDYRKFLKDYYDFAKGQNGKFSFRYFAQRAGFSSGSFLKLVMDGKRNLTNESISKVSKGFKLNKQEYQFFEKLVFMNQASTHEIRNDYYKQMLAMKAYTKVNRIARASYDYFSKWYYPAIREIVTFGHGKLGAAQIATMLDPAITEKQAADALNQLVELGLIKQEKDGTWAQCDRHITTGQEVRSFIVAQYHREMLAIAADAIERFTPDDRDISAMTFSVEKGQVAVFKELIAAFRDQVRSRLKEDRPGDQVLQLNIQLFPLTRDDGNGP